MSHRNRHSSAKMNVDAMIKRFFNELGFYKCAWLAGTLENTEDLKSKFSLLWSIDEAHHCLTPVQINKGKSEPNAERMRTEGNIFFRDNEFEAALDCYNSSILLAPHPKIYAPDCSHENDTASIFMCKPEASEQDLKKYKTLALGYGNRSAVFMSLKEYDKCLADIDLALLYGYPELMKSKLEERRERCLRAKERNPNSGRSRASFLNNDISPEKLADSSPLVPAFSSAMKPMYSTEKGRHVVAAKDIQPGDIIALEESHCSFICQKWDESRCVVCLKQCRSIMPCPTCRKALFCSDACRARGLLEHERDCKIMQIMKDNENLDSDIKLALKLLNYTTFAELKDRLPKLQEETKDLPASRIGFGEDGKFTSKDYRSMYHAVSFHSKGSNVNFRLCLEAFIATKILLKSGTFFVSKDGKPFTPDHKDFILTGTAILHHINCQTHVFALRETKMNSSKQLTSEIIGYGFFPSISMLRHSCNANTTFANFGHVTRLMAIGFIPAGQEVFVSYVGRYQNLPLVLRKVKLEHYGLHCSCEACVSLWPLKPDVPDTLLFKCEKCNGPVTGSMGSPYCMRCDINYCKANSSKNPLVKKWWYSVNRVKNEKKKFDRIFADVQNGQSVPKENFITLCKFSKLLHQHVMQPAKVFCHVYEAFSSYCMIGV